MIFLWALIVVELIIILLLLSRPKKDITKEEELEFEKTKNSRLSKLNAHISEVKENSLNKIREYQEKSFQEISVKKDEEYLKIKDARKEWELEEKKQFEEFKLQQEQIKLNKKEELERIIKEDISLVQKTKLESEVEIGEIEQKIEDWRNKYDAAVQVYKKLDKDKQAGDFYRIQFDEVETEELEELNGVIRKLKNPMPFYKAVHDIYYRNKVSELVKRVVGISKISGIYKITHIESGKCYVGQSVDIGNRWKQHIKRGVGADKLTQNKLYPALMKYGITNFTFEIVETTEDTSKLNEMEQYWQDFLSAKDFGFSMK